MIGAGGKGREEAGGFAPGADEVVGHEADLIDDAADGTHVGAAVHAGAGADGYGEEEAGAEGVHLAAEFEEESFVVFGVGLVGVLPVDVDAVEEVGDGDAGGEVAFEKDIDAGGYEGFAVFGLGVDGEVGAAAFERDEDADVGELALEFLKLVEVAAEGLGGGVGGAVDGLGGGEGVVEVGFRVGDGAAAVGDEALGIVDLVDEWGFGAGDEVLYEVWRIVVETPLREVADEERAMGSGRVEGFSHSAGIVRDRQMMTVIQAGWGALEADLGRRVI